MEATSDVIPRFGGVRLTPAAYRRGLALALPDAVVARTTGVERASATYVCEMQADDHGCRDRLFHRDR